MYVLLGNNGLNWPPRTGHVAQLAHSIVGIDLKLYCHQSSKAHIWR